MGSIGGFAKGQQPMLDRIKDHNNDFHLAIERRAKSASWWLKFLYWLGIHGPYQQWEHRQPLDRYWPKK